MSDFMVARHQAMVLTKAAVRMRNLANSGAPANRKALALLFEAVRVYPEYARAYYEIAVIRHAARQLPEAVEAARRAADLDPASVPYLCSFVEIRMDAIVTEGYADYSRRWVNETLVRLDVVGRGLPESAVVHAARAHLFAARGDAQSVWERELGLVADGYQAHSRFPNGSAATERAIAGVLGQLTRMAFELASLAEVKHKAETQDVVDGWDAS